MRKVSYQILLPLIVVLNAVAGVSGMLALWLMCGWGIDDASASVKTPATWGYTAIGRVAVGLLGAFVMGGALAVLNRSLYSQYAPSAAPHPLPWFTAGIAGWAAALGAIVGSAQFFIHRPFM